MKYTYMRQLLRSMFAGARLLEISTGNVFTGSLLCGHVQVMYRYMQTASILHLHSEFHRVARIPPFSISELRFAWTSPHSPYVSCRKPSSAKRRLNRNLQYVVLVLTDPDRLPACYLTTILVFPLRVRTVHHLLPLVSMLLLRCLQALKPQPTLGTTYPYPLGTQSAPQISSPCPSFCSSR